MSKVRLEGMLPDATCKYCNGTEIEVVWRLKAKDFGTYSIAGMQPKIVAQEWPYAVCHGCGHESEGKVA